MNIKTLALAGLGLWAVFSIHPAHAERYCREYTRTITVGGIPQSGYGTACYQPDGSWEVVNLSGAQNAQDAVHYDIRNDLYRENNRVVIVDRYKPVYYAVPSYRYYPPVQYRSVVYKPWPYGQAKKYYKHDRYDRHDDRRHHNHR